MRDWLKQYRALLIVAIVVSGAWLFLRTSATPLDSIDELDVLLARGEPVVLEFFSNT